MKQLEKARKYEELYKELFDRNHDDSPSPNGQISLFLSYQIWGFLARSQENCVKFGQFTTIDISGPMPDNENQNTAGEGLTCCDGGFVCC